MNLDDTRYLAAAVVALLGGVHCVGMCSGIVGALTLGLPAPARGRFGAQLPFLLAYNAGRLASYTLAGALAGGVGAWAAHLTVVHQAQLVLQAVAGACMVALGLYLAGWWRGLLAVERLGAVLWRRLEPFGRRLLPVRSPLQALAMGAIWGWLPCGLVYSVVIWAVAAGSAREGALLLLSFGIGTLPALLTMGVFAATLAGFVRRPAVRIAAGLAVLGFGLLQLARVAAALPG